MPILNRFAKAPRAWPPPRTTEEIRDAIAYAEERDPLGTAVHLSLAMLFCASIALSTAMTSVSFVLLVGYTALRLPNLWRSWMPLVASPLAWLWIGWTGWTTLNAFWSADLERWRDSLGSFWCVALIPALFPLSHRWRLLFGAFLAGAVLQGLIQLGQAFGLFPIPAHSPYRPPGIGSHPGHVTTSAAIALMIALASARESGSTSARRAALAAIALTGASIVLSAGRGAILGVAAGLAALVVSMQWRYGIPWRSRRVLLPLLAAAAAVVALAGLTVLGRGPTSLGFQLEGLERTEMREASSVSKRVLWWQVSLDALREHPVRGIGTGSLFAYSSENPRVAAASRESGLAIPELAARHPHSFYMLIAAEQGAVGLAWLAPIMVVTLRGAWRSTAARPVACGILAGMVVWLVAAQFECLNLPLRTASMFLLLTAVASLPRGPAIGLEPWKPPPDAACR